MRLIEQVWFHQHSAKIWLIPLLLPFSILFWLLSSTRRLAFKLGIFKSFKMTKPVIVVGNIGVGGNGKTPVVIYLVEMAKNLGLTPGVVSRGYGGKADHYPYLLNNQSTAKQAGDEPVLIYQRCHVPVTVGADRIASAQLLIEQGCDVIISDDGLQHYRLQRDVEIIVVDGKRKYGNGLLLPAGPLREGQWRLQQADFIIYNGKAEKELFQEKTNLLMTLSASKLCNVGTGETILLAEFLDNNPVVNAIAGIGDPQRFFDTLLFQGFDIETSQGFIDHKDFNLEDINTMANINLDLPLLMTEKDAVKCKSFTQKNWWYLPVNATFLTQAEQIIEQKMKNISSQIQ